MPEVKNMDSLPKSARIITLTVQVLETKVRHLLPPRTRIRTMLQLSYVYRELADRYLASVMARECLDLAAEEGDLKTQASILNTLANIHYDEGDAERALGYYRRALEVLDALGGNEEMRATLLTNLGGCLVALHRFDDGVARANYEYYEPRCSHNSSLSHAAHGFMATRIGELEVAHRHFRETATVDMLNVNHPVVAGTFIGGIHTAACGGTYQLAVHGFGGLGYRDGFLTIDPKLPTEWTSIKYPISWRMRKKAVTTFFRQLAGVYGQDGISFNVALFGDDESKLSSAFLKPA